MRSSIASALPTARPNRAAVEAQSAPALRISAGARVVSECWNGDRIIVHGNLERQFECVSVVLEKIGLLLACLPDIDTSKGTS